MADNYLNKTVLGYFYNRIKTVFASQTDFSTLSAKVEEIISEGGEPNVIETVKVDGTALTPDAQKAVNIDLSGKADAADVPTKTSDLTNDGDGTSNFATEDYVDENGGKIDKIKVNNVEQTITNKTVDITVPEDLSDLTNTSADPYVKESEVDAKVVGALKPKGSVAFANLPALTAANLNNMYNVTDAFTTTADFKEGAGHAYPAGTNVAIINDGTDASPVYKYDAMAGVIDMSGYWSKTELTAITTAEIDTIIDGPSGS